MQKIMKKFAVLLLAAGMSILHAEQPLPPVQLDPRIPRKIEIGAEPLFEMVKDGQVNFEIVVPADAPVSVKFAGSEAASLLGRTFGTKLTVLEKPTGNRPAIVIGSPDLASELGVDVKGLDRDGFVMKTFPGGVLIIGRDSQRNNLLWGEHATLFGTYDFLERFAGMHFYLPGKFGTIIPRMSEWRLPSIDLYDRPDSYQRCYSDYNGDTGKELTRKTLEINRLRHRYETTRIYYPHTLRYLTYGARFGKSHPEYFSLQKNGKRVIDPGYTATGDQSHFCYSSEGFKKEVIADIISCMKGEDASVRGIINPETGKVGWHWCFQPGKKIITLSPPDCVVKCTCPKCAPILLHGTKEQQIEHYWSFFRDVAMAVKDAGIDGYIVIPCHYGWWEGMPPSFPIPDNIILSFAVRGAWNELTPDAREKDFAELKAWAGTVKEKMLMWTYPGKYFGEFPGIPATTPRYAASFLKRAKPYVVGCYFESSSEYIFFNYLNFYIYGKILWNSETDVEKLLDEHAGLMFGPAAGPMKEFFDSIERNWMKIAGHTISTNIGPVPVYPSEREMWNTIYSPAERERINDLFAEAEKLTTETPEYLERVKILRREMWLPAIKAADNYECDQRAIAAWGAYMPETGQPPVLDGKLDDPEWKQSEVITLIPTRKAKTPCEVRTTVRALRDKDYFYFGFECEDRGTPQAFARDFDNRDIWRDSGVEVFLSPDRNPERCYQIMVNACDSIADLVRLKDKEADWSWNSGAEAKSVITPGQGWITEIRIPRSSLPQADESGMLANLTRRYIPSPLRTVSFVWGPFYLNNNFEIHHFGTLRFQPESEKNLIPDGDFDGEPDAKSPDRLGSWRWFGSDRQFPLTTEYIISGKNAALLDSSRFLSNFWCVLRTLPPVKPGKEYILTFFAKLEDVKAQDKEGGFYVRFDDFDGSMREYPTKGTARLTGTMPWIPMEFRFKTTTVVRKKDIPGPGIDFTLRKATGKVWIDHVRLVEAPSGPDSAAVEK